MSVVMDGKALSAKIKENVKSDVVRFYERYGRSISLAVVIVGNDPASQIYVKNKTKACEYTGVKSLVFAMDESATQEQVVSLVKQLASNDQIDGILVQLPLPEHIVEADVLNAIPVEKDVDGFKAENLGKLLLNKPCSVSCTPKGIMRLLREYGVETSGKNAVILGRSNIVGKPIAALLLNADATVTVCHSKTSDTQKICRSADILVAAVGRANFVTADYVKKGATVIDVGINRTAEGIKGDVDFDEVQKVADYITPVPGGVGPMTITMLLENTIECAFRRMENV